MSEGTQEEQHIELTHRSDEVQDILTFIPSWVVRWGITVIFGAIVCILICAWIIRYPEVVKSRIVLTSDTPASKLVARTAGAILLMAQDKQQVKKGQYIAAVQNPLHTRDVMIVRGLLDKFKLNLFNPEKWEVVAFPKDLELGELQTVYNGFLQRLLEYEDFIKNQIYKQKIEALETQIGHHKQLGNKLQQQKDLLVREVDSAKADFAANEKLYAKHIISKTQLTNVENRYLDLQRSMVEEEKGIIHNQIQLDNFESSLLELRKEYQEKERAIIKAVGDAYNLLVSNLSLWEQQYILIAPIDGEVTFLQVLLDNHFVKAGEELIAVVPTTARSGILGKLHLTEYGAGKIKPGSIVRIRLDSYPYRDFGTLEGKIETISRVSSGQTYFANVSLPDDMITSYGKKITFRDGMQGDADVIAYDLRLILRLFNYLRFIFVQ